jgi:hypothetical protein
MHRLFEHRLEHWREIAGRGIDDPQHVGGRGLSLQRLVALGTVSVPLGGALVELPSEFRVGALKIGYRVVNGRFRGMDLPRRANRGGPLSPNPVDPWSCRE